MAEIAVSRGWGSVAYDGGIGYVYVGDCSLNATSVIIGTAVVSTIPLGRCPVGVAYDSGNGYVYLANPFYPSNSVSLVNGTTLVATLPVPRSPWAIAYDNGNGYVYVGNVGSLNVINGTKVIANITSGIGIDNIVHGIAYDGSNGYVYATDYSGYGSNTVNVVNRTTVIANVTVGRQPWGVGYDSGNRLVYVTNQDSNTVSIINGTTIIATVPVGSNPRGVAYDSDNGYVYVTNNGDDSVTVINGTRVVTTIAIPGVNNALIGATYDSENRYVYVAGSNTVNVISTNTDFSLWNGGPVSVIAGSTAAVNLTLRSTYGAQVPIQLSCAGHPLGFTCVSFSVNPVTPTMIGSNSVLTFATASSVSAGSYNLTVTSTPLGERTAPTIISVAVSAKTVNQILGLDPAVFYAVAISIAAIVVATIATVVTISTFRALRNKRPASDSTSVTFR